MAPNDAATTSQGTATPPASARQFDFRRVGTPPRIEVDAPPFWGDDGFSFGDLLDLVNPLQHIPLVGGLYRALTGDEIAFGPRVLGGALFAGGPIGAAVAVAANSADGVIADRTGRDAAGHVFAWVGLGGNEAGAAAPPPVELAEVSGLPWLPPPVAAAAPSAPEPAPPARLEVAEARPAAAPPAEPALKLSPAQWQALTASLSPEPEPNARGSEPGASVAASMARALDKYESLTRDRARTLLVE